MKLNSKSTTMNKLPAFFHLGILTFCAILFIIFLILANMVQRTKSIALDSIIKNIFLEVPSSIYNLFETISWFASNKGIITLVVAMLIWLLWKHRDFKGAIVFVIMVASSNVLNKVLKGYFERERPLINDTLELGYSFPSGGAITGLVAYGLAAYLILNKKSTINEKYIVGLIGAIVILLIGLSRIVLSVHYLTDVIAGHLLGIILLIISIYLYRSFAKR
ncbi:phosphatase PAP2 family protein [Chengkuizengella axinellae]|uniref:Phosphatase PAP2 family protein n=1 Tax=Chengkuizengella axinellae TaxID=3064388 RepID=A0ABT9IXW7_9BACL|nr:phosphatase PAP2 family protein [Chengkuizengella sp. 2205SS18-9]MDP5274167.1 phosphatase PAP2 family protein [Chengkuizengella sp. 2205SS18-9]